MSNVVVLCRHLLQPMIRLCVEALVSRTPIRHHPYQNNFTDHKPFRVDYECPVRFSHYGFGPFGAEPGQINFVVELDKGS